MARQIFFWPAPKNVCPSLFYMKIKLVRLHKGA